MKRQLKLLFTVSLLFVFLVACQPSETYKNVSIEDAKQMIDNGEVVVLDVRTNEEYAAGHIPNAILIPVQELADRVDELDREETYLIVCRSGNRSVQASEILLDHGFQTLYNLEIGMNGWKYEVEVE